MTGAVQDVDYTEAAAPGYVPVENITFPDLDKMPDGEYVCKIHNWRLREPTVGGFRAEIEFEGKIFQYEYDKPMPHKQWITVAVVTKKDGKFSIEHMLPCSESSQEVWGVQTQQFARVSTIMLSPNHWDDQKVGNKHVFFMLFDCKNQEPTRGIYNEYLRSDLNDSRKVFEVLGQQTMCPVVDDQLSGLGFSSTRGDAVTVIVETAVKRTAYKINF